MAVMTSLKFILKYIFKTDKKYIFVKIVNALISGFFPIINVIFLRLIVDSINNQESFLKCFSIVCFFTAMNIIYYFIQLLVQSYDNTNSSILIKNINIDIIYKMISLDLSFFENSANYDIYQKAKKEAGTRAKEIFEIFINIISLLITFFSVVYILIKLNIILLFILFIFTIFNFENNKKIKNITVKYMDYITRSNRESGYIYNILTSKIYSKEIKIFDISLWLINKYKKVVNYLIELEKKYNCKILKLKEISNIILRIQNGVIIIALIYNTLKKRISLGSFTMYFMAAQTLTQSLNSIMKQFVQIYESCLYINNLIVFFNTKPNILSGIKIPEYKFDSNKQPFIKFENVCFCYPNKNNKVLNHLTFTINKNEKILLVGENGAGKSTLIKLLLRLYDPTSGEILFSNENIKLFSINDYRKIFSIIFQDYNKYAFSIAENILLNDYDKSKEDEIRRVIELCGLKDKINSLSQNINTSLTREFDTDGTDFSGGEMQKLALCRAFIRNSPILVLDEPTSSLDPNSEYNMYSNYFEMCKDKTVIFISHRLSCAHLMDRILLLKNGKICEEGTHVQLLSKKGEYFKMYVNQSKGYIDGVSEM